MLLQLGDPTLQIVLPKFVEQLPPPVKVKLHLTSLSLLGTTPNVVQLGHVQRSKLLTTMVLTLLPPKVVKVLLVEEHVLVEVSEPPMVKPLPSVVVVALEIIFVPVFVRLPQEVTWSDLEIVVITWPLTTPVS